MNWLTEKLNLTIIALFLIGLLVGGLVISVINTKRPEPLFSSASEDTILEACEDEVSNLETFIDSMPDPIPASQTRHYWDQSRTYLNQVIACAEMDKTQFIADWDDRREAAITQAFQEWLPESHAAELERDRAWDNFMDLGRETSAARAAYEQQCIINPTDKNSASGKNIINSKLKVDISRQNEDHDCQELLQAYEAAAAASEEAYQTYEARLQDVVDLSTEWAETERDINYNFGSIRDEYEEDYSYTLEYAADYANTPFDNVNPNYNGYYNSSASRAY